MKLQEYFLSEGYESGLADLLLSLAGCVKKISEIIRVDKGEKIEGENVFGESQVAMDVLADRLVFDAMKAEKSVRVLASEEMDDEVDFGKGCYGVAHDPLDGSSLIDVNLAVGSIFGVYETETFYGVKGSEQVASLVAVYGPRTTLFVCDGKSVSYFVLVDEEFVLLKKDLKLKDEKAMFAPGNLRACTEREDYLDLLNFWAESGYQLRYSGAMVPDVGQILLKGGGVFTYPDYAEMPDGKLRVLYECAPLALMVEAAGGVALSGKDRILDIVVDDLTKRAPIFIGSKGEVERVMTFLG